MNILDSRTPRERAMVYGAAALVVLLLIWQVVLSPVFSARANAKSAQTRAVRDYVIVRDGVGALAIGPASAVDRVNFDRTAVIETAREQQLPISRIQPESDGEIKVWFEDASSPALYRFMTRLTQVYDTQITRAQINRNDDGTVSAQITFGAVG